MANPSIEMSDDIRDEVDDRRHSTTSRSAYVREAIRVRLLLEDRGEFDSLLADAEDSVHGSSDTDQEAPAD